MELEVITIDLTECMTPDEIKNMAACNEVESKIRKFLENNGFTTHVEIWVNPEDTSWVEITLTGDWKHAHIRLNNIMGSNSYKFIEEEEDEIVNYYRKYEGMDYYCSTHIFRMVA